MLDYGELKDLSAPSSGENYFLSVYLNVNPLTNPKGDYILHFKNMIKEVEKQRGKDVRQIKKDFGKIETYLKNNKREFKKSVAIISSTACKFWRDFHLHLPVKNELIIDRSPYIKPLLFLLNNYPPCAVLLVDREWARIFLIRLGEIGEYTELFTPDIPGKHKKGGWFSLQQRRFERHIDYHVRLHIKDVVRTLEEFLIKETVSMIMVGGSEDAILKVKDMLPKMILQKLISTFSAGITMGEKEVLEKASGIIESAESGKYENTVEELITRARKNDMAVLGLEDVLSNLQEGKVMKLVFLKDSMAVGFKCIKCGFLTTQVIGSCPYCAGDFEKINYLVDFIAQRSVELDTAVVVITRNERLRESGGIGAFLRF